MIPKMLPRKARRIPPSELTEDANQGQARVVRERGVCAEPCDIIGKKKDLPYREVHFHQYQKLT